MSAVVLLAAIRLFTNLFYFQTWSLANRSPATHHLGAWSILVPALGGLIVGLMARFGTEKIRGHGIPEAIEAILFGRSRMSPKVAVLKPLSSGIVIGSGGPFGAEGPIIMTGGAAASLLAQAFHLTAAERKALLVAGACAGMTAVFGTPLAAILLAVELLLFELRPRSLLPVALSCAVAGFLRPLWADGGPLFPVSTAPAGWTAMLSCLVAGLASGAVSAFMTVSLYWVEDLFQRLPVHWMWWPAIGGLAVGVGGLVAPRALGVGYDVIGDLLAGHLVLSVALTLLAMKFLMWAVALGSGTSGGVLAPLLMIGAGLGTLLGPWLSGGSPQLWPLVCMAAILGGTMRAPLTAIVFALGLTHDINAFLPTILACTVAYGFTVTVMPRSILTEKIARRGLHVFREYGVDVLERYLVAEVMTRAVVSIPGGLTVAEARERFFGPTQLHRAYPVITDEGRLIGMLERNAVSAASLSDGTRVDEHLSGLQAPPYLLGSETCRSAAHRLAVARVERLPVVDSPVDLRVIGILSRSDLLKPRHAQYQEESVRERLLRRWRGAAPSA